MTNLKSEIIMTERLHQKLSDSKVARWSVLALAAFTMLCGYILTDVMAPLKPMLEEQLHWNSTEYGFFTSAYGWFNVFLFMLIIGGIILDKMGVRFTGVRVAGARRYAASLPRCGPCRKSRSGWRVRFASGPSIP